MEKCVGHQSLGMTSASICGPIPALCRELEGNSLRILVHIIRVLKLGIKNDAVLAMASITYRRRAQKMERGGALLPWQPELQRGLYPKKPK